MNWRLRKVCDVCPAGSRPGERNLFLFESSDRIHLYSHPKQSDENNSQGYANFLDKAPMLSSVSVLLNLLCKC